MSRLAVVFIMEDADDSKTPKEILEDIYFDKPEKMFENSSCHFAFKFKTFKEKVRLVPRKDITFKFEDIAEDYTNMRLVKSAEPIEVEEQEEEDG